MDSNVKFESFIVAELEKAIMEREPYNEKLNDLLKNPDIKELNDNDFSLLLGIALHSNAGAIKPLAMKFLEIKEIVSLNEECFEEKDWEHSEVFCSNYDRMKWFIKKDGNVNRTDSQERPPIYYAVHNGDPEAVRILLDAGADISFQDKNKKNLFDILSEQKQFLKIEDYNNVKNVLEQELFISLLFEYMKEPKRNQERTEPAFFSCLSKYFRKWPCEKELNIILRDPKKLAEKIQARIRKDKELEHFESLTRESIQKQLEFLRKNEKPKPRSTQPRWR